MREQYPIANWRILPTAVFDGPTNMAMDEAILHHVAQKEVPPTIRFYGWEPGCVTVGYGQTAVVVNEQACIDAGWDITRRATGGRAILHTDELTYMICVAEDDIRVRGGIMASYRRLSEALVSGLSLMGLSPEEGKGVDVVAADIGGQNEAACFDGPGNYEICLKGKKLVGSAQMRKRGVVLQHGTIPLYGDIGRLIDLLQVESEAERVLLKSRLLARATTLDESLGRKMSYKEAANYMKEGFQRVLNLQLERAELSSGEVEMMKQLRAEKYGNPDWVWRRGKQ